jgi:hypothetical protein
LLHAGDVIGVVVSDQDGVQRQSIVLQKVLDRSGLAGINDQNPVISGMIETPDIVVL